jgi:hypothetical protein
MGTPRVPSGCQPNWFVYAFSWVRSPQRRVDLDTISSSVCTKVNTVQFYTCTTTMKPEILNLDSCLERPYETNKYVHFETDKNMFHWNYGNYNITLFTSITLFYETNNIPYDILHIQSECGEYPVKHCQSHRTLIWIWIVLWIDRERNMIIIVMCFLTREVHGTMIVTRVQQTQDEVVSLSLSPTNNSSA